MKLANTIIKILTALAAVAGVVYIVATYGEQIVAWCKKALDSLPKCPKCEAAAEEEAPMEEPVEVPAEEVAAEEAPAEEAPAEEVVVEEVPVSDEEPVADEADFAE